MTRNIQSASFISALHSYATLKFVYDISSNGVLSEHTTPLPFATTFSLLSNLLFNHSKVLNFNGFFLLLLQAFKEDTSVTSNSIQVCSKIPKLASLLESVDSPERPVPWTSPSLIKRFSTVKFNEMILALSSLMKRS